MTAIAIAGLALVYGLLLESNFIYAGVIEDSGTPTGDNGVSLDLCDSPIYCQGDLLKTVQLSEIFRDSKTFVDLYQKNDEDVTLANFKEMMSRTNNKPNQTDVRNFVEDNFLDTNELINATLPDWHENPSILGRIKDSHYRGWASALNDIWKGLARRMTIDVKNNPKRHSLIYVDNTFIIPGGRFKEFYYWDSYWVVEGLLLNDMWKTTKGIIENFLSMVNTYGFIPNGGRVYYLMRSQPPLLIPMVDKYYEVTKDWDFVIKNLPILEKEFNYWMRYKTVKVTKNGKSYTLAHYVTNSDGPRPESYREDYVLAENIADSEKKRTFYNNVKAGAESGWDFSARWFIDKNGKPSLNLHDITTEDIIPVDLNAFIERNARILADFFRKSKNLTKMKMYTVIAKEYREAIKAVLWNEKDGIWYDYDTKHQKPRALFYPSNLTPLYTMSYNWAQAANLGERAVKYLKSNGITDYSGGSPTSLDNSSQQWDFPNAWPPLQSIIVQGLRQTDYGPAMQLAESLAFTWLRSNYLGFAETKKMYEKYDATKPGKFGGGGEYNVQEGFGWTNGVILEFLDTYPWASYNQENIRQPAVTNVNVEARLGLGHNTTLQRPRQILKSVWSHYCH